MALDGRQMGREIIAAYVRAGKLPEDKAEDPDIVESMVIMAEVIVRHIVDNAEFDVTGLSVDTTVPGSDFSVAFPTPFLVATPTATVAGSSTAPGTVSGSISVE